MMTDTFKEEIQTADVSIDIEKVYGPNGKSVVDLITRMQKINWYSAIGKQRSQIEAERAINEWRQGLNLGGYPVNRITKSYLPVLLNEVVLETIPMWTRLGQIYNEITEKAEECGRQAILLATIDSVSENMFHDTFDQAFREFEEFGESVVKVVSSTTIYAMVLACAWETIADIEGWERNHLLPFVEVFEQGHWSLGLVDDQFYVL
ncbi:hypothetical protein [Bacillus arachidis]|uniref:Uncharacterized protein n=1 Tax=Bacillus arachidis TaxID=2819290 RepID=A0ABS3P0U7_9BACI|nr:hypothetical protein [Bacillus arachidis]MBO1626673.1 hypothetical protein [Bacillus arachidis]